MLRGRLAEMEKRPPSPGRDALIKAIKEMIPELRGCSLGLWVARYLSRMEPQSDRREMALLAILIASGEKAIEAFQASDNPVDVDFLADLERIIERSRSELVALKQANPEPS
jgi:hypothetical protein